MVFAFSFFFQFFPALSSSLVVPVCGYQSKSFLTYLALEQELYLTLALRLTVVGLTNLRTRMRIVGESLGLLLRDDPQLQDDLQL